MTTLRPAWYSVNGDGFLSDIINLIHPPYTLWHLSYVLMGIALAPKIFPDRSIAALLAFFLGLGIGAHALDETMGNPLKTRLSKSQLYVIGLCALSSAILIGVYYALTVSSVLLVFVGLESFFAIAYNLEMFERRFHNALVFALSWGVIPFLAGYYVNALNLSLPILVLAAPVGLLTVVQKTLSTEARKIRRKMKPIDGLKLAGGEVIPASSKELVRPIEISLQVLTLTVFLIALGLLSERLF